MSRLIEPVTGWEIHVHSMPMLGGDEQLTLLLSQGFPNPMFLSIQKFDNMVFLYEMDAPPSFKLSEPSYSLPEPMGYDKPHTVFLKAIEGSTLIRIDKSRQDPGLYSGLCFRKVDALTFIELKETVNVQAIKEALETQQG